MTEITDPMFLGIDKSSRGIHRYAVTMMYPDVAETKDGNCARE